VDELEARLCSAIVRTFDAEAREAMLDALYALRRARWTPQLRATNRPPEVVSRARMLVA
jgi:hypothetical protein